MSVKSAVPYSVVKIALAGLLVAALWACTSPEEDNGKYAGTLGEKNREYQWDTTVVDDCASAADSALRDDLSWQSCGHQNCTDSQAVAAVDLRLSAACKESGGTRDTLYIVHIDNGASDFYSNVDPESFSDTSIHQGTQRYDRYRVALIPYRSRAQVKIEKVLVGDYFVVKTPNLTEESEVTAECYSEAELTPGYKQWWPADFSEYPELKEVDLNPGGGVCELGDKYRITVKNP
jgi:hypothetical protein